MRKIKILLVEDNPVFLENGKRAEKVLAKKGINVEIITTNNLYDAIRLLTVGKIKMLITDVSILHGETPIKMELASQMNKFNFQEGRRQISNLFYRIFGNDLIKDPEILYDDTETIMHSTGLSRIQKGVLPKNPDRVVPSTPLVALAKKMKIPFGIVTAVHNTENLGNLYLSLGLIDVQEVVAGTIPFLFEYKNRYFPNLPLDFKIPYLESRVLGVREEKTPEVWAQSIINVLKF